MHIYNNVKWEAEIPHSLELLNSKNLTIQDVYPPFSKGWFTSETKLNYPKIENGVLVEKTDTELKLEGIIPLLEGEVISNNEIATKPKPNGFKIKWNGTAWVETATLIEKEEILRNNIISKTSELLKFQSAGFNNLEIEKELDILRTLHMDITHQIAIGG